MVASTTERIAHLKTRLTSLKPVERVGQVVQVTGLVVESIGPDVSLGQVCELRSQRHGFSVSAEVVGFRDNRVLLMPLEEMGAVHPGCQTVARGDEADVPVGMGLLGRVINGLGQPLDDLGSMRADYVHGLHQPAPNPMRRQRIVESFRTGVTALDLFAPMGVGQRMGVFAGSGVGKSTLMGMIARGSEAEVNVVCLVGERGRELREFLERDLGPEGLARSVVVVSTSDQPAPLRLRAAFMATRIAEQFRSEGRKVLFMMDSITRLAMAQREVGLAIGEPPASRGYTPSVFALLPRVLERTGMGESGSITALYTVLVEGDDMNEPVADTTRGILDGHVVLSRALASAGQYPAVDVLDSLSRLCGEVCSAEEQHLVNRARDLLALYNKNEDLITVGAYVKGQNPLLDQAIDRHGPLLELLRQPVTEVRNRDQNFQLLARILNS